MAAQGGGDLGGMARASLQREVRAEKAGVVQAVDAMEVALAALRLGAGRVRAEDAVDHAVGFDGLVKIGERVAAGGVLAVVHANDEAKSAEAEAAILRAVKIGDAAVVPGPLVAARIG